MNEKNINQKDDSHSYEKVHSNNIDNSSNTPKVVKKSEIINYIKQ